MEQVHESFDAHQNMVGPLDPKVTESMVQDAMVHAQSFNNQPYINLNTQLSYLAETIKYQRLDEPVVKLNPRTTIRYSLRLDKITVPPPRNLIKNVTPSHERVIAAISRYGAMRLSPTMQRVMNRGLISESDLPWVSNTLQSMYTIHALVNIHTEVAALYRATKEPVEDLLKKYCFGELKLVLSKESITGEKQVIIRQGKQVLRISTQDQFIRNFKNASKIIVACILKLKQYKKADALNDCYSNYVDIVDTDFEDIGEDDDDCEIEQAIFDKFDKVNTELYMLFKCMVTAKVLPFCNKYVKRCNSAGYSPFIDFYQSNKQDCNICYEPNATRNILYCPKCDNGLCAGCYDSVITKDRYSEIKYLFFKCPYCRHQSKGEEMCQ